MNIIWEFPVFRFIARQGIILIAFDAKHIFVFPESANAFSQCLATAEAIFKYSGISIFARF